VALLQLLNEYGGGQAPVELTLGQLLHLWQQHNAERWSPSTARITSFRVRSLILPHLGDRLVAQLRPAALDAFYAMLRERGGADGRPLSHNYVRSVHGDIRRALALAWRWGWVPENVALRAELPPGSGRVVEPPSVADVVRVITAAHAADPDWGMWLQLAAVTGARRGELYALRWSDVDLDAATVTVERALVAGSDEAGHEQLVEKSTKTGNRRTLALDAETMTYLRAHRRRAAERAMACGLPLAADAYLFSTAADSSTPTHPRTATRRLRPFAADLGVDLHPHALRHFMVSELLAAGVDLATVAGRAGHAGGGRTTLQVYAHLREHADQQAADVMASVMRPAAER
jgi:integrase